MPILAAKAKEYAPRGTLEFYGNRKDGYDGAG